MKYQVSRTKRRINEDIVGALLAGGSIGAAERAETKCRLLINHLQEVWVYKKYGLEQKVQTCTQTFRTNLALEKGRSCVKSGRRGSWRYANFGRWSTSEAALTAIITYKKYGLENRKYKLAHNHSGLTLH